MYAIGQQLYARLHGLDGFLAAAGGAFLCLLLVALMRPRPPSPFFLNKG